MDEPTIEVLFEVVVGNVGVVYRGASEVVARLEFGDFKALSQALQGMAANEAVTLIKDGEIVAEYMPYEEEDEEDIE